ncbi:alcohol dehydrogenase catalytic domain-containing protein [Paraferrimonas sedimenticola]|nr:zinc-binding dehydrogenase [Paraferrimonas sedimenticola]
MRAVTFNPNHDTFQLVEIERPSAGEGDVLIKVDACGLNPVDAKIALWKSMAPSMDANWVAGLDVSGHIVELGAGVSQWRIGDRVLCHGNMFRPCGGFAEYSVQAADTLVKHPNVAADVAAATPCAGWTAWRALFDKLRIEEHDAILITGGSGGVGSFAVQIAAEVGLSTIIASCSAANVEFVRSLGATEVVDYHSESVTERVLQITHQMGVPIALDTVGPDNDIAAANALGFEGQLVELVDTVRPLSYHEAFMKGLSFHQLSLGAGHRNGDAAKAQLVASGTAFSLWLERGRLRVPQLQSIDIESVPQAMEQMLQQRTVGKIVMSLEDGA